MAKIEDGTGRGFVAKVDSANRLVVSADQINEERTATALGEAWAFGSSLVSFTSSTASGVLYLRNTSERDMVVDRFRLMLGTVTGGTGDWLFRFVRNPTGGTLISNAVTAGITNLNHASSSEPVGEYYRGVQGDTVTGGSGGSFPFKSSGDGQYVIPNTRLLPKGSSIAIQITPPPGTTAAQMFVVCRAYYDPAS